MKRVPKFEERLLLARRRRQMSQYQLAKATGFYTTDICKYERGVMVPNLHKFLALAEALQVSANFLSGQGPDEEEARQHPTG